MIVVERAVPKDREAVERLLAAYIASEGLHPRAERIAWAVDQAIKNRLPGVLLVARGKGAVVGAALAVYTPIAELGRVLTVNDFFVDSAHRRRGVGWALATRFLEEARDAHRPDRPRNPPDEPGGGGVLEVDGLHEHAPHGVRQGPRMGVAHGLEARGSRLASSKANHRGHVPPATRLRSRPRSRP